MASPRSVAQALRELRQVMAMFAPSQDWSWVTRNAAHPSPTEIRAAQRPRPVFDPVNLLRRALSLMDEIDAREPSFSGSVWHRDALMTAMECLFALRRRNLAAMRIGNNLILGESQIKIHFEPGETKTGRPLDAVVPAFLKPYLRSYLKRHRPRLLAGHSTDALWISRHGNAFPYECMNQPFTRVGQRLLGAPITCHDFRYSVVSAQLTRDPRKLRRASSLLGHASVQSVNRYYDHSGDAGSRKVWSKLRRKVERGR
jgi:integrase